MLTSALYVALVGIVYGQCKPGDVLVGEDADQYYCMERSRYIRSGARQFALDFCQAKTRVAADQAAIGAIGFSVDSERFELYANIASEQKAELQRKVLSALFDQALDATQVAVDSASSLNPVNVNHTADWLREKGFNDDVIAAARYIAQQKDKPAKAAAYRDFVRRVKAAKEASETSEEMSSDAKNARLRLIVGGLKMMQGDPALGLVVTGTEFIENMAYLLYLSSGVSDLAKETDSHLVQLDTLTKRLVSDVARMNNAKARWRTSTGFGGTTPSCPPP